MNEDGRSVKAFALTIFLLISASLVAQEKSALTSAAKASLEKGMQHIADATAKDVPGIFDPFLVNDTSLSTIENLIKKNPQITPEKMLESLETSYPSFFDAPALNIHSNSFHAASPESPRVLSSSQNGKLVMTFNGDPSQRGYDRFELMEYDDDAGEFHFHEILFDSQGKAQLRKDPQECITCHSTRPPDAHFNRPIWDEYPNWPRFMDNHGVHDRRDQEGALKQLSDSYIKFREKAATHPRYRFLHLPPAEEKYRPENVQSLDRLTQKLFVWNKHRISMEILKNPQFEKYKEALLGTILLSQSIGPGELYQMGPDFGKIMGQGISELLFPDSPERQAEFVRRNDQMEDEFILAQKKKEKEQKEIAALLQGAQTYKEDYIDQQPQLSAVVNTMLSYMGMDLRDYSPQSDPSFYANYHPFFVPAEEYFFLENNPIAFPSLMANEPVTTSNSTDILIKSMDLATQYLKMASHKLKTLPLNSFPFRPAFKRSAEQIIAANCQNCHEPEKLKSYGDKVAQRIESCDPSQRMPYGYPQLSDSDIKTLIQFIQESEQTKKN
jgi:hypothetical protein